jgi:hypothetical protein
MIRVKDPKVSIKFYTEASKHCEPHAASTIAEAHKGVGHGSSYGCKFIRIDWYLCILHRFAPEAKFDSFTVYFLAFDHSNGTFSQEDKRTSIFGREGMYYETSIPHFPIYLTII